MALGHKHVRKLGKTLNGNVTRRFTQSAIRGFVSYGSSKVELRDTYMW